MSRYAAIPQPLPATPRAQEQQIREDGSEHSQLGSVVGDLDGTASPDVFRENDGRPGALPSHYQAPFGPTGFAHGLTPPRRKQHSLLEQQETPFIPAPYQRRHASSQPQQEPLSQLTPAYAKELRELPEVQEHREYVQKATEAVKAVRQNTNRLGRFLGLATGFSVAGIATISTVAAVTHAAPIALFATLHFALPMTLGLVFLGLLAAYGVRSWGRVQAQNNPGVRQDADYMVQIANDMRDGRPTGARSKVIEEAYSMRRDVNSPSRDFRKTMRDGLAGLFWPVTAVTGFLNETRRKI